jgi:signal transduction histidine kinase
MPDTKEKRQDGAATERPGRARAGSLIARLVLQVVGVVLLVTAIYMVVSHRQRSALLEESTLHQAELLGAVLQSSAEDLLRQGRVDELDRLLRLVLQDKDVYAALVISESGPLAGDASNAACLMASLPQPLPSYQQRGRSRCGAGVAWTALPMREAGGVLIVAIEEVLLRQAVAAALRRQVALAVFMVLATALALSLLLQQSMSQPLRILLQAVRRLPASGAAAPLVLRSAPREIVQIATALQQATAELEIRRGELVARGEEQMALERRLAQNERFAMIGRLSGSLAHELGSPLSVIGMRAQLIAESAQQLPGIRREAETIRREVERMTTFIQGLLHLSRTQGIAAVPLDLCALVEELVADMAQGAAASGVTVRIDAPDCCAAVAGNETMLRHALHNVIRNAVQAVTAARGGKKEVVARVVGDRESIALLVEDTGPGIPPADLPWVFEPFHTTRASSDGIGLGLPVSRGIVEEHRGQMTIENRPEGGVRVTIVLPRAFPAAEALAQGTGT